MSFARELAEAVEAPSIPEQISFLDTLDEHVSTAMYTGYFTEEVMERAMATILRESGVTPDDLDEVYEAIDEFLDEELDAIEEGILKSLKKMAGAALKAAGKEVAKTASKEAAKRLTKIKTKTKTGKMLKHAAAGAAKQIGKDPGKAKEILKKSAAKAGKKLVRGATKKGMKMVFGKWVKTEHEEMVALDERRRSSKRAEVERAFAKRGTIRMPRINPQEYPKIKGMEGPFQFRDGRILYYDPREGRYYDRKTDMYLARGDIPEDSKEMLANLQEVDGFEFPILTEAVLTKGLQPIFEKALGVEMDKRHAKKVINEFVKRFREAVEQKLRDYSEDPDTEDSKTFEFEEEGSYIPQKHMRRAYHPMASDPPEYWSEDYMVSGETEAVTKMSLWVSTPIGIPDAVDLMAGTLKRLFDHDAFIALRRNLARALLGNPKIFKRLLEEAVTTVYRSWKYDDLDTDAWDEEVKMMASEHISSRDDVYWNVDDAGSYSVYLDRMKFDRKMKPVSSTAGPGSDIQVTFQSFWRLDWDEYPNVTHSTSKYGF